MKILYKPLALIISVIGGLIASAIFNKIWALLPTEGDEAPDSTDEQASWRDVAIAATVQGAVFGIVKAMLSRAGARGFQRATGTWPG